MRSSHVTIKDIAEQCHVSTASVSRALNNKPGVSDDLRKTILAYADAVGYVPDAAAQSMRLGARRLVHIVIRIGMNERTPLRFPDQNAIIARLGIEVQVHTLELTTDLVDGLLRLEKSHSPLLFAIIGPCLIHDQSRFSAVQTPLLFVASHDAPEGYPTIDSDDFEGSQAIVESMIAAGHRRIALLTESWEGETSRYPLRIAGYRRALAAHGIPFDPSLVYTIPVDYNDYLDSARKQLQRQLAPFQAGRPIASTAVFVLSDFLAFILMGVLWHAEVRVPDQLSVGSFGGWKLTEFLAVPVHSWVQPLDDYMEAIFVAISCILESKPFPTTMDLQSRHPDGSHGYAYATSPTHMVVPGYLRRGASLAIPSKP